MTDRRASKLISNIRSARETISEMSAAEKRTLEKSWDVEHAYYSSSLEGSKINRKEFERIGKNIK